MNVDIAASKDMKIITHQNPPLDRWVQRLTTATLVALAAGLLATGIAFYWI